MEEDVYFERFRERRPDECRVQPGDLIVRPALLEDRDELAAIVLAREGGTEQIRKSQMETELAKRDGGRLLLVAQCGERLAGFGRAGYFDPPAGAPANTAPAGWYLLGLIIAPPYRRRGLGHELTRRRLQWISEKSEEAFYFANARNRATIALHDRFGFTAVTRDFFFPQAAFSGGAGILYRVKLREHEFA
jgi:ribosomal protein S18 acetylase RimI-like enzyme